MSNTTWIGYTLVLDREPNFVAAEKALGRVKSQLETLIAAEEAAEGVAADEAFEALLSTAEDMLTDPEEEGVDDAGDIRLLLARVEEALNDASIQWPPLYDDGDCVYVGDKIVVFAGDNINGGEPDGEGYYLLRGLCTFKAVLEVLQGCGVGP